MQIPEQLIPIITKFLAGTANAEEKKQVYDWYHLPDQDEVIVLTSEEDAAANTEERIRIRLRKSLEFGRNTGMQVAGEENGTRNTADLTPTLSFKRGGNTQRWRRIAVAASILLLIGLGSYFLFFNNRTKQTDIAKTQEDRFKNDVNPGGYKARLTLADGRVIILDSIAVGELTKQGSTAIINKDGQLVYQSNGKTTEVLYNTLSTAKGEMYATVLADGSKVWLNSASSIKYPVAFVGNERKVEITGEAYFEVASSPRPSPSGEGVVKRPFIVSVNGMNVEVLGTHFNVNAYSDEATIKTTLLEGSVKVTKGDKNIIIKPGEQANVAASGELRVTSNADIDAVMAWKNGQFYFDKSDIQSIMRQVSRWYDVTVDYEGTITEKFGGTIPRNVTITKLLQILEMTNHVHFGVEGKKITVME